MTYLADVNIWAALSIAEHVHEGIAKHWFTGLPERDSVFFCRVTQQGLLRLLTNPTVMKTDAYNAIEAWGVYDAFAAIDCVAFAVEPPELEAAWRKLSRHSHAGPNSWTDAYLSAFALTAGHTLVTFDRGFRRYPGLKLALLA
jgi:uncharacterized protein